MDAEIFGERLAIGAVGMVCATGLDAATSCASIRAGLTRFQSVNHFHVLEEETQELVALTGSPVFAITEGFGHVGRWLQMARMAFEDLAVSGGLPPRQETAFWKRTLVAVTTPVMDDDRFAFAFHSYPAMMQDAFAKPLAGLLNRDLPENNIRLFMKGRTGTLEAVRFAARNLGENGFDRMIAIAVDSYLDRMSLEWLAEQGRLKTGANPTGLIPGEAAAAFLLEPSTAVPKRGAKPLAIAYAQAVDRENAPHLSGEPNHGRALSRCLNSVLGSLKDRKQFSLEFFVDLNGETWRAHEYGTALTRLPARLIDGVGTATPVASTGDVGTANTAAAIVYAVDTFRHARKAPEFVAVVCGSLDGNVGAMMLKRRITNIE